MPDYATTRNDLGEHPAVRAWCQLQSVRTIPEGVQVLKNRRASKAYRLAGVGPGRSNVIAKWCSQANALTERTVYQEVLPRLPLPTLRYYGLWEESGNEFCWVFTEDAGGTRYSPGIAEHRVLAAEWLGVQHTSGADIAAQLGLPDRGPGYYLGCLYSGHERICRHLEHQALDGEDQAVLRALIAQCDLLEKHWRSIEEACARMPRTLVHADCHADNLRVRTTEAGTVFLVFDWEAAGWAVAAVDLAIPELHIPTYWSVVQKSWPGVNVQLLQNLSYVGKIFQLLALLDWESRGLGYQWPWKLMKHMRCYQLDMSRAIEAVGFL